MSHSLACQVLNVQGNPRGLAQEFPPNILPPYLRRAMFLGAKHTCHKLDLEWAEISLEDGLAIAQQPDAAMRWRKGNEYSRAASREMVLKIRTILASLQESRLSKRRRHEQVDLLWQLCVREPVIPQGEGGAISWRGTDTLPRLSSTFYARRLENARVVESTTYEDRYRLNWAIWQLKTAGRTKNGGMR